MEHSKFTDRFSWMTGVQEYYDGTKYQSQYDMLFKALYHNNQYRLRDCLIEFSRICNTTDQFKNNIDAQKSYYNVLLNTHLDDYDVKTRMLIGLVNYFVGDNYTKRLYDLHNYFLQKNVINPPQLKDFFSRGQVMSKKWLVSELNNIIDGRSIGTVAMYGAWYNFLGHMLYENFNVDRILSIDIDPNCVPAIKSMYQWELESHKMKTFTADVGECTWKEGELWYVDQEERQKKYDQHYNENYDKIQAGYYDPKEAGVWNTFGNKLIGKPNLVINTSCEHMDNRWFNKLPDGTFVVLQTNDYFDNPQHVNCVGSPYEAKEKYPMSEFLYVGYLNTELYTRFMLIGIK
jgi:hypothetical protein